MDDPDEAREYDAMDHTLPTEAIANRLRSLSANGRMLDLGVGGGHIPIGVAAAIPDCMIIGVDLSPMMLDMARARIAAAHLADRITVQLADVKRLPFADASFDAVFSNTILHHIPQPAAMLAEAWRVLRPGGVLVIRDLFRPPTADRLAELVDTHAPPSLNTPEQRRLLAESLHAALTPDELRSLAAEVGMTGVTVVVESDRHMVLHTNPR